jgi:uncharacterized protein (DUF427 family)
VNTFGWKWIGKGRPPFAFPLDPTKPNQESVWDYPRPPAIRPSTQTIHVKSKTTSQTLAESTKTIRICETAGPPCYYVPTTDVALHLLEIVPGKTSGCEWKGMATYWREKGSGQVVGWSYDRPNPAFESIKGYLSFYAGKVVATVDGETVVPQPSDFYGGWVTSNIIGPFKGDPRVID